MAPGCRSRGASQQAGLGSGAMSRFLARAAGQAGLAALAIAGAMAASAAAADSTGVALVEQVTGSPAGVEFMDYVRTGQIIRLGSHQSIVLAYVSSCLRETITGPGTVTIGTDRSDVQSAEVRRTRGQCNVGKAIVPDVQGEFGARSFAVRTVVLRVMDRIPGSRAARSSPIPIAQSRPVRRSCPSARSPT
jgi:hypothetical protein